MKTLAQLKKQKRLSREDLLAVLCHLESKMVIEGFSRVLDLKEDLGFNRNEEAK